MLLTKIIINNFGVYRGHNEFNFTTVVDKPIILCGGTNGAGKTTLFESILLCLYGQDFFDKKITKKQYDEIILRSFHRYLGTKKSADEISITVEFQFSHDGKIFDYQVIRLWQNNDGKIDEVLSINKKELSEKKFSALNSVESSEWQIFINHLLPRGITKLFFFDGEKIQNIADEGEDSYHIKTSFDTLLGLDLVKQLYKDIGLTLLRESKDKGQKVLDEIDKLTKEKQDSERKIEHIFTKKASIQIKIDELEKKAFIQEEKFTKIGGQFATKREQLSVEKIKLESTLENIKKNIQELCYDILPFSLIPKHLETLKLDLQVDKQKIQKSFEKKILKENFNSILNSIKSSTVITTFDNNIQKLISEKIEDVFQQQIDSISNVKKPVYDLSIKDMDKMEELINHVNDSSEVKLESLAKSYRTIADSLEKIKVGLESAPLDDEIGPVFSEFRQINLELVEQQNEFNHLNSLESQERSLISLINSQIKINLTKKFVDKKRISGVEIGAKVQGVLDDYSVLLRNKKLEILEGYILDGINRLLHKKDFIEKISIDKDTFEIKLYKGNDDEITKNMLSKGELQMYATAIVWGLAKTSGRPLPFMIDTPLARLDEEHRENLVENFYPYASHQTIILSTNSEINSKYYKKLKPYTSKSFVIGCDSTSGQNLKYDTYFFNELGEKIIEIQ